MLIRARAVLVISVAVGLMTGCTGGSGPAATTAPVRLLDAAATPTALVTEPAASDGLPTTDPPATATLRPTQRPKVTSKPASFYKPPGWDGSSDVDCPDFDTHAHAQSFFRGTGGSTTNDPYRLDRDHDGIACETLP